MSFDWADYLELAQRLAQESDDASLRSAISRAYYSVYHAALKRLLDNGLEPPRTESHTFVWRCYRATRIRECEQIGLSGGQLSVKRVRADYHSSFPGLAKECADTLSAARKLLDLIQALPSEKVPTRAQVEGAQDRGNW